MQDLIYLWNDRAPYSDESPDQAQPSLAPYPVDGSKGAVVVCAGGAYAFKSPHEAYPVAEMINEAGTYNFDSGSNNFRAKGMDVEAAEAETVVQAAKIQVNAQVNITFKAE